ncbi:MAG: yajC [Acidimicrobiales bacterium]|nr:yajC [Acidimicrobiales bacterium]
MYTVMIRPQQRRAREHQALVAAVEVGDEVMTTAGIFGSVTAVEGDVISIEISPGVVMRVARAAIGRRIVDEPEEHDEEDQDDHHEVEPPDDIIGRPDDPRPELPHDDGPPTTEPS